jgi:hypothetical protein
MSPELDKQLCEKYPLIFADRHADMTQTAMCWGFDCGDGWYNIIDIMCFAIQSHINYSVKAREYDIKFNKDLEQAIASNFQDWPAYYNREPRKLTEVIPQVVATQVKEKFGGLRFYYTGGDDHITGIVTMAELMSERTCEECGDPGQLYTNGWHKTLCVKHAKEAG